MSALRVIEDNPSTISVYLLFGIGAEQGISGEQTDQLAVYRAPEIVKWSNP
jgi:hypothetical protein